MSFSRYSAPPSASPAPRSTRNTEADSRSPAAYSESNHPPARQHSQSASQANVKPPAAQLAPQAHTQQAPRGRSPWRSPQRERAVRTKDSFLRKVAAGVRGSQREAHRQADVRIPRGAARCGGPRQITTDPTSGASKTRPSAPSRSTPPSVLFIAHFHRHRLPAQEEVDARAGLRRDAHDLRSSELDPISVRRSEGSISVGCARRLRLRGNAEQALDGVRRCHVPKRELYESEPSADPENSSLKRLRALGVSKR